MPTSCQLSQSTKGSGLAAPGDGVGAPLLSDNCQSVFHTPAAEDLARVRQHSCLPVLSAEWAAVASWAEHARLCVCCCYQGTNQALKSCGLLDWKDGRGQGHSDPPELLPRFRLHGNVLRQEPIRKEEKTKIRCPGSWKGAASGSEVLASGTQSTEGVFSEPQTRQNQSPGTR